MNIGRILDRSFKILRDNFVLIYTIILIVYFPLLFFQYISRYVEISAQQVTVGPFMQTEALLLALPALFIVGFVWVFIVPLGTMAVTSAIHSIYMGRKVNAIDAYRNVLRLFLRALALLFIVGFLVFLGTIMCFVPGIIVHIIFYVVFPVCVIEKRGIFETLERSIQLTKNNYLAIFAITFLVNIAKFAVTSALSFGSDAIFTSPSSLSILGYALGNFLGAIMVAPLDLVVASMVYFELREEKEGFDLELLAQDIVGKIEL